MAENRMIRDNGCKEAACIDAGRVYDSCGDKDCAENMRVYFCERDQMLIDRAVAVRPKSVEVIHTYIDVEALPFNRGYYSCDITFYFEICLEVSTGHGAPCAEVCGVAMYQKKVILYGSEGNVKVFCNENNGERCDKQILPVKNMPRCCVQVADPVILDVKLMDVCETKNCCCCCCCCCDIPESICNRYGSCFVEAEEGKAVLVTVGLFTIVQLIRKVQMLVPVYDYCLPNKECCGNGNADNPCEIFQKMCFPVNEFFPPAESGSDCGCGCSQKR